MESRINDLEEKFSHQEQLLEQLNEVVTEQQLEIDKIKSELKHLKHDRESGIKDSKDETPPPHY